MTRLEMAQWIYILNAGKYLGNTSGTAQESELRSLAAQAHQVARTFDDIPKGVKES